MPYLLVYQSAVMGRYKSRFELRLWQTTMWGQDWVPELSKPCWFVWSRMPN